MADVMDGHNVGMAKYGKLEAMQKKVKEAIDSISKLPAKKAQQELAPYKTNLIVPPLTPSYALYAMDTWMGNSIWILLKKIWKPGSNIC